MDKIMGMAPRFCAHCDGSLPPGGIVVETKGRLVGYCNAGCRLALHATATAPVTRASLGRVLPRPGVQS